jgi:hypothetical protein
VTHDERGLYYHDYATIVIAYEVVILNAFCFFGKGTGASMDGEQNWNQPGSGFHDIKQTEHIYF